jgi:hypothetical protein
VDKGYGEDGVVFGVCIEAGEEGFCVFVGCEECSCCGGFSLVWGWFLGGCYFSSLSSQKSLSHAHATKPLIHAFSLSGLGTYS